MMRVHKIISSLALLLLFFSPGAIAVQSLPAEQGSPWISEIEYVEDAHQVLDAPTALKLLRHYNNPLVADQVFNIQHGTQRIPLLAAHGIAQSRR